MGHIRHATAAIRHAVREKIQNAEESLAKLASRYNINPKTAHKWQHRESGEDLKCGRRPRQDGMTYTTCCRRKYPH